MKKLYLAAFAMMMSSCSLGIAAAHGPKGGNVAAGRVVYMNQCSDCHSNKPYVDRFGPTLAGVYGRMSGTAPLHQYSAAMKSAHILWTENALDDFLKKPRAYVHGTTMPYGGLESATARANVIAYLQSISPKS